MLFPLSYIFSEKKKVKKKNYDNLGICGVIICITIGLKIFQEQYLD